jgi:Tol biopolymer transport system component
MRGTSVTAVVVVSVLFVSCASPFANHLESYVDAPPLAASVRREPVAYQAADVPSRVISFETTEGTFMSVDVSPNGETLIFDLLGDIYQLPFDGGEATQLTSGRAWDRAPRFSPDGKQVYFVSDRKDYKNIWRLALTDQSLQRVTHADSDILGGPSWSQDRDHLLAGLAEGKTGNSEIILQSIDPVTGAMTPIDPPSEPWFDLDTFKVHRSATRIFSGAEPSGGDVFFSQTQVETELGRTTIRMYKFDRQAKTRNMITPADATYSEYKPQLSRDGNLLAYLRQYSDRRTEIRILNRTTGQDEALVELMNADDAAYSFSDDSRPNYAFTPDDQQLIFWHDGKIHRVNIADGISEIIPFRVKVEREVWERSQPAIKRINETGEAKIVRWPTVSHDGKTIAFAAVAYIWLMDLTTGKMRRLTGSVDFEYMPAISPDGRSVAYVSFTESEDDAWTSRLMVAEVDGGTPRQVLAGEGDTYLLPQWSQDGQKIALIKEDSNGSTVEAVFGWTLATGGAFHGVAKAPASSEPLGWFIYARFVGFDQAGRNLLFSFLRSRRETVLAAARLDGSGQRTLAIGTPEVAGITPAPDLNNLALTRQDGSVWVVPFDAGLARHDVSTTLVAAQRVSVGAGYYVNWNHPNQMTFGFGQNVYRYKLNRGETASLRIDVALAKPIAARQIAFTGARLITLSGDDGIGPLIESGTVILDGQRIVAVGRESEVKVPSDAIVIDAAGKTIMPGLIDVHYHRIGGNSLSAFKLPSRDFSDKSAIIYGVTTAWEPGGAPNDGAPAMADLQQTGRIAGPRWSHSATGSVGYPWEQLTTYAKALAAVEQHRELGVAVLKEYNTPTRKQQQWLSKAAHQLNLGVVSHIQSFDGMMTRIVDGYTGGDHPYIPVPFFKDVRELLRQTGYVWTPNIVISNGNLGGHKDVKHYFWQDLLKRRPYEYRKLKGMTSSDRASLRGIEERPSVPYQFHRVSRVSEQVASAAKTGVRIGISAHNMPGLGLHQEMWFLRKGGLSSEGILRAVTMGNAEKLGLREEIGSLEPGKIADFIVLDENPLDDILNTLSLRYTVQGGVVYHSDTAQQADLVCIQE